jgi:DNA mismatch endonuclease (patch repair protein)
MEKVLRETLEGGRFQNVTPERSRAMSAVRGKGNRTTEVRFRMALVRAGVTGWCLHPRSITGTPDFYFTHEHAAVFVDGCFWHGCPVCGHLPTANARYWSTKIARTRERDEATTTRLQAAGIIVVRFWEHEVAEAADRCVASVQAAMAARRDTAAVATDKAR